MLKEEFYILQDKEYDNYEDIVYEGNLIGFVVATDLSTDTIQLNIFYILPQYRGKGIFAKTLQTYLKKYRNVILDRPNRFAINSLIENGLAKTVSDTLVETIPQLSFEDYTNNDELVVSNLYDLKKCAIIDKATGRLSPLQDVDVYCYRADYFRD